MMKVNLEQIESLANVTKDSFIERMLEHTRINLAPIYVRCGRNHCKMLIQNGIAKSGLYELKEQKDIAIFISLMFVFGENFDADECFPWAQSILNGHRTQKVEHLYNAFLDYLRLRATIHNG